MLRILSALILLPIVLGVIWYTPPIGTWLLGGVVLTLAFVEYAGLARQLSPSMPIGGLRRRDADRRTPRSPCACRSSRCWCSARSRSGCSPSRADARTKTCCAPSASRVSRRCILAPGWASSLLVREQWGVKALLIPFLTIVISDSAQYYGGRTMGRRPLAPAISPKKTVEGAITGIVAAAIATPLLGAWAFPGEPVAPLVVLGVMLAAIGICGDLFESLLKRSAGVKDASGLIPGHGGMLDRIDSLLFAGPVYYLFLRYAGW